MPVAGVEPARVISPTDFESASSANSNTPASKAIIYKFKLNCNTALKFKTIFLINLH